MSRRVSSACRFVSRYLIVSLRRRFVASLAAWGSSSSCMRVWRSSMRAWLSASALAASAFCCSRSSFSFSRDARRAEPSRTASLRSRTLARAPWAAFRLSWALRSWARSSAVVFSCLALAKSTSFSRSAVVDAAVSRFVFKSAFFALASARCFETTRAFSRTFRASAVAAVALVASSVAKATRSVALPVAWRASVFFAAHSFCVLFNSSILSMASFVVVDVDVEEEDKPKLVPPPTKLEPLAFSRASWRVLSFARASLVKYASCWRVATIVERASALSRASAALASLSAATFSASSFASVLVSTKALARTTASRASPQSFHLPCSRSARSWRRPEISVNSSSREILETSCIVWIFRCVFFKSSISWSSSWSNIRRHRGQANWLFFAWSLFS
mmetsp:Transcript_34296/g.110134  ORF Transcript_34296/g.110134 Transcript_34296/m.110134 type:complete len:391 (-) Transcript_34296:191-1363(-)